MWLHLNCRQRQKVVVAYLHFAGFDRVEVYELPPTESDGGVDPLNIVVGIKSESDRDEL